VKCWFPNLTGSFFGEGYYPLVRRFSPLPLTLLILTLVVTCAGGCHSDSDALVRRTRFLMGTLVEVTVREPDAVRGNAAINRAFDEIARLEQLMSPHLPGSEISRLTREAGGEAVPVAPEVLDVIRTGVRWGQASGGALDITIGPVADLWDFDDNKGQIPPDDLLRAAVKKVGFAGIEIRDGAVRLARPGMELQLGAVAKGYAVDRAMALLRQMGIEHALINAGGDLAAIGFRGDRIPWRIGLQHPRAPEKMIATFTMTGNAVATSGDYQRYFEKDGVRYHHIFDPKTGLPAREGAVISATVVAPTVMDADALATAIFVLGPPKGLALVENLNGVEALMVNESGEAFFSSGFESLPDFHFLGFKQDGKDPAK